MQVLTKGKDPMLKGPASTSKINVAVVGVATGAKI